MLFRSLISAEGSGVEAPSKLDRSEDSLQEVVKELRILRLNMIKSVERIDKLEEKIKSYRK